jgi:NhaP-type Na+/H+ or K+/H+ antiporter
MSKFSLGLDFMFNCACFIYIGAWLPFDKFHISEIGVTPWRLVILMLVILTLRRIPSLLLLYKMIPEVKSWREALFCGYFGPVSAS